MVDIGAIFLHRKLRKNPLWTERRIFSKAEAWIDILMEVRWQEETDYVMIGNTLIECRYGQSLNSLTTWANRWKWSEAKVRRVFDLFEKSTMIRRETVGKTTRLTVCNFYKYQHLRRDGDAMPTRCRRDADAMPTTEEEVKKLISKEEELKTFCPIPIEPQDGNGSSQPEYYITKRKRKLTGKRLESFKRFWEAFAYKNSRAPAADAWLDIPKLTDSMVDQIVAAAKVEAARRSDLLAKGLVPKMAQGWISERRWEDEGLVEAKKETWAEWHTRTHPNDEGVQ